MAQKAAGTTAATLLVLQGNGALGSYQAGVHEALEQSSIRLDWIAGISIGTINAAIIAGNAPADRLSRLKQFGWEATARAPPVPRAIVAAGGVWLNEAAAARTALVGAPGLFAPRLPPSPLQDPGSACAVSLRPVSGDPQTGELWGNYPQTYSLAGPVNYAVLLSKPWSSIR